MINKSIYHKSDVYEYGHIDPWWGNDHRLLGYVAVNQDQYPNKDHLRIWKEKGYGFSPTSFGSTYTMAMIMPDFTNPFMTLFNWDHVGLTFYRQYTGDVLPLHSDYYEKYSQIHGITNKQSICRCIVFLEDWASGHYFEIDNNPIIKWKAGDYVTWQYSVPHLAANMGFDPRYTLQITGISNEKN